MTFTPQSAARHQQNLSSASTKLTLQIAILCVMSTALVSGCVSSGEYEAEKARALNFQRLLAQEEQRTGELDVRLQEAQQEIASLGSQNRELSAERDALQEQVNRRQTSAPASDVPDMDISPDMSLSDSSLMEFEMDDFSFDESDFKDLGIDKADASGLGLDVDQTDVSVPGGPTYHTVGKKKDGSPQTLWSISQTYGVKVEQLMQWNNLTDHIIQPGQRLIVSQP